MRTRKKYFSAAVAAVLVCGLLLAACSAGALSSGQKSTANDAAAAPTADMARESAQNSGVAGTAAPDSSAAAKQALANQKIIERMEYRVETLEFDKSVETLQSLTEQLGGYIQEFGMDGDGVLTKNDNRTANFVLRIPQEKLKMWKEQAATVGSVLSVSSSTENITEAYYDTETRLNSLRAQQERLLELMKKADKMADIVELEKALAEVTSQIEQLTGTLRQYDSLVGYSTVTVNLFEVSKTTIIEKTPVTLGEKIAYQFRLSLRWLGDAGEGLLVAVVGGLPILLPAAVLCAAVWLLHRRRKRRRTAAREQKRAELGIPKPEPPQEKPPVE